MIKRDHLIIWIVFMILLAMVMHQVILSPSKLKVSPFQFMDNEILEPGAFSIAPPAATVRSQTMSCHKCGGRKRQYTN